MAFTASSAQRALGERLTQLRKDSGWTHRDVRRETGIPSANLSRMENAKGPVNTGELRRLLEAYGQDESEITRLLELARDGVTDAWWERWSRFLHQSFVEFLAYENDAREAWAVQTMFVPGLLQTEDYIRALHAVGHVRDRRRNDVDLQVRLRRQRRLTEPDPLVLHALMAESVLHWQIGGNSVLAGQFRHLIELNQRDHIHIRIIPFSKPIDIYPIDYMIPAIGDPVAFPETQWGTPMNDDPIDTEDTRYHIERYEDVALSEEETSQLLEQRIRELEK
ncbi:helix-turn-helix domain-containing protein [Actinospica sp. MGRD01-02]|uniref:Helix-turn-helix domain-containing protein n=1 Tax=Actinospica acidithermotolerans TaxID=2828514 RepID=A0A941IE83_9ACTN|nr:helix-turn-helix transcriptional regulator [Actinospica acidithermotolerans]MBR7824940.1 helix-turn-helix domain-containing protein [Actinospica acidithermotolerans]